MEQGFSFNLTNQSQHSFHFGGMLHCVWVESGKCVLTIKLNRQSLLFCPLMEHKNYVWLCQTMTLFSV